MTPTPLQQRLIKISLFGPSILFFSALSLLMVRRNIGVAWFLGVLAVVLYVGISELLNRYEVKLPTWKWTVGSLTVVLLIELNAMRGFFDGKPHFWLGLIILGIVFALILLPFLLFFFPNWQLVRRSDSCQELHSGDTSTISEA